MLLLFLFSLFITVSSQPSADQTGMPTQCQSGQYVTLNHPTRRTSYYGSNSKCDYRDFTLSVWYYFGGDTGYGYIITSPVTNINWAGNWAATVPCGLLFVSGDEYEGRYASAWMVCGSNANKSR